MAAIETGLAPSASAAGSSAGQPASPVVPDLTALAWVEGELRRSLEGAHKALRRFLREAESPGASDVDAVDPAVLHNARQHLHQGVGVLELVGLPAAATVLRAGEALLLRHAASPQGLGAAAVAAVERASFALLDYIGRLLAGHDISPLALFPQYRAVQEAAGAERIHPADLWAVDWRWLELPGDPAVGASPPDAAARRLLEEQLLALMKAAAGSTAFQAASERMSLLCARLGAGAQASADQPHEATLWKLAAAVFEAQARGLLQTDVYSKRVASRLLQQFRRFGQGDDAAAERLAQDLLFFCSQSAAGADERSTPQLAAVCRAYGLDAAGPVDYASGELGRFDPAHVSQARKRVAAAKDSWAALAAGDAPRIDAVTEQFALVGDSLQRLYPAGEALARALQAAAARLLGQAAVPRPELAMEVATGLLHLDASLADADFDHPAQRDRVLRLAGRIEAVDAGGAVEPLEPWMEALYRRVSDRQTIGSVVHEMRVSLAESEQLIDRYFRDPARPAVLEPVQPQLQAMRGVLSVLGLDDASQAVLRMRDDVQLLLSAPAPADDASRAGLFDRLAGNLGALGFLIDMFSVQPELAKSLFAYDAESGLLQPLMGRPAGIAATGAEPASLPTAATAAPAAAASGTARAPAPAAAGEALPAELAGDPEMLAIFLEEAAEVLAEARRSLAVLAETPDDLVRLTTLRRAFHTLKGSSRMVGLAAFGESAWTAEQVFNRQLGEQQPVDAPLQRFAARSLDALAGWVDEVAAGRSTHPPAVAEITAACDALDAERRAAADRPELPGVPQPALEPGAVSQPEAGTAQPGFDDTGGFDLVPDFDGLPAPQTQSQPVHAAAPTASLPPAASLFDLPFDLPSAADLDLSAAPPTQAPHQAEPTPFELSFDASDEPSTTPVERDAVPPPMSSQAQAQAPIEPTPFDLSFELPEDLPAAPVEPDAVPPSTPPESPAPAEPPAFELSFELPDELLATPVEPEAVPPSTPSEAPAPPTAEPLAIDLSFDEPSVEPTAAQPGADDVLPPGSADAGLDLVLDLPVGPAAEPVAAPAPSAGSVDFELPQEAEPVSMTAVDFDLSFGPEPAEAPARVDTVQVDAAGAAAAFRQVGPLRIAAALFDIYMIEADGLSQRLEAVLADWSLDTGRPVGEEAVALAHSLAGSSATVGFAELSQLARSLEHTLTESHALGHGTPEDAQLFNRVAERIRRLLHQFAAGFLKSPPPGMTVELADREVELAQRRQAQAGPEAGLDDGAVVVEATDEAGLSAVEQTPAAAPPLPAGVPGFGRPEFRPLGELPVGPVRAAAARADAPDADDDIDAVDAVDAELFPIFEDEARELLPQLAASLREWAERPDDGALPAAAMRALHTLKGGARLAGAMRLGEMCHRLETRIEHLLARLPVTAAEVEPLQARADALAVVLDALAAPPAVMPTMPSAAPATSSTPPQPSATAGEPAAAAPSEPPVVDAVAADPEGYDWSRFASEHRRAGGPAVERAPVVASASTVRVRTPLLDRLVNQAGEVSIARTRIEADVQQIKGSLADLTDNLERLRRQLRDLELQAELQVSSRLEATKAAAQTFDPLEFDRYTRFQELTRMLAESVGDVATVQRNLQRAVEGAEDGLVAQGRLTREMQDDLLRTRMVEFESQSERLYRVVRQAAKETGKQVRLDIVGGAVEIDRGVLDRMTPSFEHLLRNCVTHGIETPPQRSAAGKDAAGAITVALEHVGNEVAVEFRDDGAGLDLPRIRARAVALGRIDADSEPDDAELAALIYEPGFSTADQVTELAGRGVGMDVVRSEVAAIGGRIETATAAGRGTSCQAGAAADDGGHAGAAAARRRADGGGAVDAGRDGAPGDGRGARPRLCRRRPSARRHGAAVLLARRAAAGRRTQRAGARSGALDRHHPQRPPARRAACRRGARQPGGGGQEPRPAARPRARPGRHDAAAVGRGGADLQPGGAGRASTATRRGR